MSILRTHELATPDPVDLLVEVRHGRVELTATETATTRVRVTGADAPDTRVVQHEERVEVLAPPRRSGFLGDTDLLVQVELPTGSNAAVRSGSADVEAVGSLASLQVRTGSGEVRVEELTGAGLIESGSGTVRVERALAELRVKSGSGDVLIGRSAAPTTTSTGSGDVVVDDLEAPAVVKTGTGDLRIGLASADVTLTTGSGDLTVTQARRGRLQCSGASGDVRVGVPEGVAVWTDVTTLTGTIRADAAGTGAPAEGQDHIELRATTVSGDIVVARA
ncbi:DUF4097 family beta strand repeat-containing protein [Nocardioides sp. zg-DK7169]|uniref:DUF4097 family beta strand repeat-containing protein n=1 Tax=Nocardioides sp. zg-DK7169 TaxID=2736600 RepID=UPI0015542F20|nr:DUF4097 family beta strand repeat-containing protein [Nocardioides sp. zg-DK7169]NPC97064.1 DUF4097 family beta strand repeat protein [Nocardioides sp. zg-DK7169]